MHGQCDARPIVMGDYSKCHYLDDHISQAKEYIASHTLENLLTEKLTNFWTNVSFFVQK